MDFMDAMDVMDPASVFANATPDRSQGYAVAGGMDEKVRRVGRV